MFEIVHFWFKLKIAMTASKVDATVERDCRTTFPFSSQNSQKDDVTMRDGSVIMETT